MKRSQRVGAICQILTESPGKIFSLSYFCEKFSAAKSSISEDISAAKEAVRVAGYGYIETIPGASGGVKYVTDISPEKAERSTGESLHPAAGGKPDPGRRLSLHVRYHVQPRHRQRHGSDLCKKIP